MRTQAYPAPRPIGVAVKRPNSTCSFVDPWPIKMILKATQIAKINANCTVATEIASGLTESMLFSNGGNVLLCQDMPSVDQSQFFAKLSKKRKGAYVNRNRSNRTVSV